MATVVIMRGGLGDIVLAQRALSELKSKLAAGELRVATEPRYADIFLCSPAVDRVLLVDGARAAKRLRQRLLADGDVVYNLDHPFSGQRRRRDSLHIAERIDEILGTSASGLRPEMWVPPVSLGRPHAILTWASSSERKLPSRADREAIRSHFEGTCARMGLEPFVIGQPADDAPPERQWQGSLLALCGAVRGASLYFGCDTGFSHVASTAEVPSAICHIGFPLARCGVMGGMADILYYENGGMVDVRRVRALIDAAARRIPPCGGVD
jgi:hypothetical protein